MKCPKCVEDGMNSRVYIGETFATAMVSSRYYDEDGNLITRDPNYRETRYSCSRNHGFKERSFADGRDSVFIGT